MGTTTLENNLTASRHVADARDPATQRLGFWDKLSEPLAHCSGV